MQISSNNVSLWLLVLCVVSAHFVASQVNSLQDFYNPLCDDFSFLGDNFNEDKHRYFNVTLEADGLCSNDTPYNRCDLESAMKQYFNDALSCTTDTTFNFKGGSYTTLEYTDIVISSEINEEERRRYLRNEIGDIQIRQRHRNTQTAKCIIKLSVRVRIIETGAMGGECGTGCTSNLPARSSYDPISSLFSGGFRRRNLEQDDKDNGQTRRRVKSKKSRYTGSEGIETDESQNTSKKKKSSKNTKATKSSSSKTESMPDEEVVPEEVLNPDFEFPLPPPVPAKPTTCGEDLFVYTLNIRGFDVSGISIASVELVGACETPFACKHSFCCEELYPEHCTNEDDVCISP